MPDDALLGLLRGARRHVGVRIFTDLGFRNIFRLQDLIFRFLRAKKEYLLQKLILGKHIFKLHHSVYVLVIVFEILSSPPGPSLPPAYASQRRKYILRIFRTPDCILKFLSSHLSENSESPTACHSSHTGLYAGMLSS